MNKEQKKRRHSLEGVKTGRTSPGKNYKKFSCWLGRGGGKGCIRREKDCGRPAAHLEETIETPSPGRKAMSKALQFRHLPRTVLKAQLERRTFR